MLLFSGRHSAYVLGGLRDHYFSDAASSCFKDIIFLFFTEPPERYAPRSAGLNGCAAERSAVLDFLVLFDQAKRTKGRAGSPIEYSFILIKEALLKIKCLHSAS
ncbi:MAG: hypothetical protein ACRYFB_12100 [Janthinobacterium lividum]